MWFGYPTAQQPHSITLHTSGSGLQAQVRPLTRQSYIILPFMTQPPQSYDIILIILCWSKQSQTHPPRFKGKNYTPVLKEAQQGHTKCRRAHMTGDTAVAISRQSARFLLHRLLPYSLKSGSV